MKYLLWKQFVILSLLEAFATSANNFKESKQCIGKHQIPLEDFFSFTLAHEIKKPIDAKNFNVLPVETILENNNYTIVIKMKYNTSVPTVNFGASADFDTYRFEFMYFQWYENSVEKLPFELHAVFYNTKVKKFENALKRHNMIVVLAFSLQVNYLSTTEYAVLNKNIKSVKTGLTEFSIENRPLNIWLPALMKEYFLYEGFLPFYNCEPQVLWVDFADEISLEPDLVKEFKLLKTYAGQELMTQYKSFRRPNGPLVINFGIYSSSDEDSMEAIPFVDAYNDYDDENAAINGMCNKILHPYNKSALLWFILTIILYTFENL